MEIPISTLGDNPILHAMNIAKYNYDVEQYDKLVDKMNNIKKLKVKQKLHEECVTIGLELIERRNKLYPNENIKK